MKQWKAFAILLTLINAICLIFVYCSANIEEPVLAYHYADTIRNIIGFSLALTESVVGLVLYGLVLFVSGVLPAINQIVSGGSFSFSSGLSWEGVGSILFWSYAILAVVMLIILAGILRKKTFTTANTSWKQSVNMAWMVLFPLAYLLEMHGWMKFFVMHKYTVVDFISFFGLGLLMIASFAKVTFCYLLSGIALVLLVVNLIVLILYTGISIPNWPYFVFRIAVPLLAAAMLLRQWRLSRKAA